MKRITIFLLGVILLTVTRSVSAQEEQSNLRQLENESDYKNNWFISLGGNANILHAEQDASVSFTKRIQPGGSFTVGKWFTPNFGSRFQISGGTLRGFNFARYISPGGYTPGRAKVPIGGDPLSSDNQSKFKFVKSKDGQTGFWQEFNYASATFDLMANFTNLFRGHYNEQGKFEFIPFVGAGLIMAFDNKVTTPDCYFAVLKLGFRLNYNISNKLAIYFEPQANATTSEFDGYVGTAMGDAFSSWGLGIQYTFNKKFQPSLTQLLLSSGEIDHLNKKINDNRYMIENHQNILERQQDLLDHLQKSYDENKNEEKEVVNQAVEKVCLPEYIRFGLDSYRLDPLEQHKIIGVVEYLKKDPNSKLLIIGYADKRTGNTQYNLSLSQKRAEAVATEMKRLGIGANRLLLEWKGDKEQPFPQNEWNRVAILVERR